MTYVTGTIAYCSREDHASPLFAAFLAQLAQRHPTAKISPVITNDVAQGRNMAVYQAEGDWLWFIDTDMAFGAHVLERLLAHNVDIVQTLCLKRHPPHQPVLWERSAAVENTSPTGRPRLIEVKSLGAGGTLYRRKVFEKIAGPWFEGVLGTEDTNFAAKARLAGFKLYVDMATTVGHVTPMVIWPEWDELAGSWSVRYDAMNGPAVRVSFQEGLLVEPPKIQLAR